MIKNPIKFALIMIAAAFFLIFIFNPALMNPNPDSALTALKSAHKKLEVETRALRKKNKDLEADRDNVLAQMKNLLQGKARLTELEESSSELEKNNKALLEQKDKIQRENQKLKSERDAVLDHFDKLKNAYEETQSTLRTLTAENEHLRSALTLKIETAPQYKKLDAESKDQKKQIGDLEAVAKRLEEALMKALDRMKRIDGRDHQFAKQIERYKQAIGQIKKENEALKATNEDLNRAIDQGPKKFREMAMENRRLLRETAEIHYNMGVFFIENKDYVHAVAEFERALEFDPNNAKVHYNLGYLYSEEFGKHDEAAEHFRRFLQLSPDAKESEAIRSYLLVHQTYGEKFAKS